MACKDYRELIRSWGALYICICYHKNITIEQAFQLWDNGYLYRVYGNDKLNEDIVEMRKNGIELKDIAATYDMTVAAVFGRIKYHAPELVNKE